MSKFKKILFGGAKENMGAVAAARLELTRRLLFTGFVLTLACLAGFAYISKAWFASNKDVGAENASVTSESGTPNLFIRLKSDTSASYYSLVKTNWNSETLKGHGLYPISTANCADWYYISDWTMVLSGESEGITTGEYYASQYAPVRFNSDKDGCYKLTFSENDIREYRAYYRSEYNLYSDKVDSQVDVYLNPNKPIEITGDEDLMQAIRVAVVTSDEPVFVYAPVKESGTGKNFIDGNSTKASADTFYAVTGTNTATEQAGILVGTEGENSLAPYLGGKVTGDPHSFTAGTEKICTATTAGADVTVYIWLEGMDAQSVINVADNRTIEVNLNFVGVPVEAASAQANGEG